MVMVSEVDNLSIYNKLVEEYNPQIAIIKSEGKIRRTVKIDKILLEDNFNKQKRNVDYKDNVDEFFSDTHLYYQEDGYKGFADFSIIGDDEQKGGFAPMAVAIHIIYFEEGKEEYLPFCLVDFETLDIYPVQKMNRAYSVRDYWVELDYNDSEIELDVYYLPGNV